MKGVDNAFRDLNSPVATAGKRLRQHMNDVVTV